MDESRVYGVTGAARGLLYGAVLEEHLEHEGAHGLFVLELVQLGWRLCSVLVVYVCASVCLCVRVCVQVRKCVSLHQCVEWHAHVRVHMHCENVRLEVAVRVHARRRNRCACVRSPLKEKQKGETAQKYRAAQTEVEVKQTNGARDKAKTYRQRVVDGHGAAVRVDEALGLRRVPPVHLPRRQVWGHLWNTCDAADGRFCGGGGGGGVGA